MIRRAARVVGFGAGVILGTGLMIWTRLASDRVTQVSEEWAEWITRHLTADREDDEQGGLAAQDR